MLSCNEVQGVIYTEQTEHYTFTINRIPPGTERFNAILIHKRTVHQNSLGMIGFNFPSSLIQELHFSHLHHALPVLTPMPLLVGE
jgi:hypothetical protein